MLYRPKEEIQITIQRVPWWDAIPDKFYCKHEVPIRSVKDALVKEVDYWRAECPVLIEAQTGLGKTTFVYEKLIPRALAQRKNVLIISNRIALSVQQKIRIMKITNDQRINLLTDLGIQKCEDFGAIRIITYHRLHELLKDETLRQWRENLLYVVADEAHFFTSDALFNRYCEHILRSITTHFCRAIRIYMTATSWDVLKPLGEAERDNYLNALGTITGEAVRDRRFHHYIFPFDYSSYRLLFIKNIEELEPHIEKNRREKWLVFCDSKDKGKSFSERLGDHASYIDSDSKTGPVWQELTKNERFSVQVLVTTAVLDCGVNIHDEAVKNVVICSDDRTNMLQMVGRKRLNPQEEITLWIVEPNAKSLSSRVMQYDRQLEMIRKFEPLRTQKERSSFVNRLLENSDPRETILFYASATQHPDKKRERLLVCKNQLAEYVIARRKSFLEKLLSGETTFQEEVNTWFGKSTKESVDMLELLKEFYQTNAENPIPKEKIPTLRKLIVALYCKAGYKELQPTRVNNLQQAALNHRLSKIPKANYRIEETPEKMWVLTRYDWSQVSDTNKAPERNYNIARCNNN